MVLRLVTAHECKSGTTILYEGQACTVKSNDISKTGKHGASKCRIEALEILTGKKKIIGAPGDTRFEVPLIIKKKGQVLSVAPDKSKASIMDLESFETIDVPIVEDVKDQVEVEKQVEYWDIEGILAIMRVY